MNACPHWREVEALRFARSCHRDSAAAVVIAGAGPVGLTLAIDLAQRGVTCVVLEQSDRLSDGSRALCWSRRTLDIFNRIGIGDAMREAGVQWQVGRVFHKDDEIYRQRLAPDAFPENPFFVNLQQPLCEFLLLEKCKQYPAIDLRWGNKLIDARHRDNGGVTVTVRCDSGDYRIDANYLIACDGAKSTVRERLGLRFEGAVFNDRFLIADIEMNGDFPAERRFWFEPPFHDGQSTLLHKQAQGVWRVDFQLNTEGGVSDARRRADLDEKTVRQRIRAFLGPDGPDFDIVWRSVYLFTCRRIDKFRHGNIFFAGDSAHVVSPFGARGGNGGVQDSDNLGWKLAEVIHGRAGAGAGEALLDSYNAERTAAGDADILNAARTTDFMTPKSRKSKRIRDSVLRLARAHDFARRMVNAGRMSCAFSYCNFAPFAGNPNGARVHAGDAGLDMPLVHARTDAPSYLLRHIRDYTVLAYQRPRFDRNRLCDVIHIGDGDGDDWRDAHGLMREHYFGDDGDGGGYVLFRPDQHILGVWRDDQPHAMLDALKRQRGGARHERHA